jgi:hypothetical protein
VREPDWFDDEGAAPETPPRRRHLLLLLATVPWLLVAALLLLPDGPAEEPRASEADAATTDAAVDPTPTPSEVEGGDPEPLSTEPTPVADDGVLTLQELRGRWRVAPGEEEAASLGLAVARASLTGLGPRLEMAGVEPDPSTYAEHLVVEAVERPSSEVAVVTILAVVLIDEADGRARVELRRLAVPIATTADGPRPVTAPWPLPAPDLVAFEPDLEPLTDEATEAAAASALSAAGLGEHTIESLETAPGWPVVAHLSAGDGPRSVWLRRHVGGLVVAGTTLADHTQGTP